MLFYGSVAPLFMGVACSVMKAMKRVCGLI